MSDRMEPPFVSRTDDRDPTSMTGDAREATEHEVPGTAGPQRPTSPTEQANLQGEPTKGAHPTPPVAIGPPFDSDDEPEWDEGIDWSTSMFDRDDPAVRAFIEDGE